MPTDDQIFRIRENEKILKIQEKETTSNLKLWEKKKDQVVSLKERMDDLLGEQVPQSRLKDLVPFTPEENLKSSRGNNHSASGNSASAPTMNQNNARRQEKENMAEFIAKKREMFLVQMSLDTKR